MKYQCPVCLVECLVRPYEPASCDICPMCGVEYGFEDCGTSHEELRKVWIAAGRPNWKEETERPDFEGGVKWFDEYFENKENEERRGEALTARFKDARLK